MKKGTAPEQWNFNRIGSRVQKLTGAKMRGQGREILWGLESGDWPSRLGGQLLTYSSNWFGTYLDLWSLL